MKKLFVLGILLILIALFFVDKRSDKKDTQSDQITPVEKEERQWQIKSIDTMKYSRDLALEKLNDPTFEPTIDLQVKQIKETGANYVAIATPYDEKFIPILERWVAVARRHNLHIWFRGNFSGWEGWFGEKRSLSRNEHLGKVRQFIQNNHHLFVDGDAFSPCPECENGGAGDPRSSGDVGGFRKFMISEYQVCQEEFKKIGKNVICNLASMNYDVAKLVMNRETAAAMGGVIAIDHYVRTPEKLSGDVASLADKTEAKIFLGEFGAPIPDIHGKLNQEEQAVWIEEALGMISKQDYVIGINYWVSHGGSTAIFESDSSEKPAANILRNYFRLPSL